MTILRLELIAAHMAKNLAANIKEVLPSQNKRSVGQIALPYFSG